MVPSLSALVALFVFCGFGGVAQAQNVYASQHAFAQECHTLTNVERTNMGLAPLYAVDTLMTAALLHAQDMATNGYFDHFSQDGRSPFDRMQAADYAFTAAAENIARGQRTPAAVVLAWMNSPGHRANILSPAYRELGVGYVPGTNVWVQNFGSRSGSPSAPYCGNGFRDSAAEQCDDGNPIAGDGCSATCQRESDWSCTLRSLFDSNDVCSFTGSSTRLTDRHDQTSVCALHAQNFVEKANPNFLTTNGIDVATCDAGSAHIPQTDDSVRRVTFFRYLAHLPSVRNSPSRELLAQQCAMVVAINHPWSPASLDPNSPPLSWQCNTAAIASTAAVSSIYVTSRPGTSFWQVRSAEAVAINALNDGTPMLEGRQRMLCPNLPATGFGHFCYLRTDTRYCAHCQHAGLRDATPMPSLGFVAFPSEGAVPHTLVPEWWSFAVRGVSLAGATVTVDGAPANSVQAMAQVCRGDGVGGSASPDLNWLRFRHPAFTAGWTAPAGSAYRVLIVAGGQQ